MVSISSGGGGGGGGRVCQSDSTVDKKKKRGLGGETNTKKYENIAVAKYTRKIRTRYKKKYEKIQ